MNEDPELQMDDDPPDDRTYAPKRRRIGSNRDKLIPAITIVLFVLIFAGGVVYFFTRQSKQVTERCSRRSRHSKRKSRASKNGSSTWKGNRRQGLRTHLFFIEWMPYPRRWRRSKNDQSRQPN